MGSWLVDTLIRSPISCTEFFQFSGKSTWAMLNITLHSADLYNCTFKRAFLCLLDCLRGGHIKRLKDVFTQILLVIRCQWDCILQVLLFLIVHSDCALVLAPTLLDFHLEKHGGLRCDITLSTFVDLGHVCSDVKQARNDTFCCLDLNNDNDSILPA